MKKILLTILPYWDPMIPPMGITSLKAFLQKHGFQVKTLDLIVKDECLDFYRNYFDILRNCIPREKQGNFNNIGHDVLQNHMMAHFNHSDEAKYRDLVKILIHESFYVTVDDPPVLELIKVMDHFYVMLKEYFLQVLDREKPDVVGVTAYKCTLPASLFVLKLTRETHPHIKTIMGGGTFNESHAPDSPNFQALLETSAHYLDKIIIGQGELLFLKYLRGELPEDKRVYAKCDIDYQILDFHQQEIPDFSDLDTSKYPYLSATASASCIYQCSFCVAAKVAGQYRIKEPHQTVKEMTQLYTKHGHQLFFMTDSLLNPVATPLADAFIQAGVSLYYDSYFRVDDAAADIQNTLHWRRGGLYRVRLGTESGSQRILDQMDKKITLEQIKATLSALAYAGIKTTTYWVIGHPGETEEDFQMTLDLIEELKDDIFQAECNPFLVHFSQQYSADQWGRHRRLLYPEWATEMLVFESYTLDYHPLREVAYDRMHRFEAHCRKCGIPNPYSLDSHLEADKRWQRLHENAVPEMLAFIRGDKYIDENQKIKVASRVKVVRDMDDSLNF